MSNAGDQGENSQEDNSVSNPFDSRLSDERIFIVGANGQLGTALRKKYPNAKYTDIAELDITNKESVDSYDWKNIDIIINAAAYTNVDDAETTEGRIIAWKVNAEAVANLVLVSNKYNLTLVHISTDYVFDGTRPIHDENENFSPISVYGQSKAAGDIAVSLTKKHYILRTSWVIGEGNNFVRTMASLASKNISPTVVHDQIGRLTFTSELVRAIDHLLFPAQAYGTYNVSNDGEPVSWADVTRIIFQMLKREDLTVTNITTKAYYNGKKGIAPRPLQSTMSLDKIRSTGFKSNSWQEILKRYLKDTVAQ